MLIYDRLSSVKKAVKISSLPNHIELGRYYVLDEKGRERDLTEKLIDIGTEKQIVQELLSPKKDSSRQLFNQFYDDISGNNGSFIEVIPLIQEVGEKVPLNSFEEKLEKELFHLEEILRQPHFLLTRDITKVNVSRAKRISNKSYQYLASHTEDWQQKTVVSFKPSRLLTEELFEYYDIYENQIFTAFLRRTARHLSTRIDLLKDITGVLDDRDCLFENRSDDKGWYKKIERNLTLISRVFKRGITDDSGDLAHTHKLLAEHTRMVLCDLQRRISLLLSSELVKNVNSITARNLMTDTEVKATNVTINHKHYRYLRDLWKELNHYQVIKKEEEELQYEQTTIQGVRDYAKAAIRYTVENCLDYIISGDYNHWKAQRDNSSTIAFDELSDRTFKLSIGTHSIKLVVLASAISDELENISSDTVVLYYPGKDCSVIDIKPNRIAINPYQADSVERIGRLVKTRLIVDLVDKIHRPYKFPSKLLPYLAFLNQDFVEFDTKRFEYYFVKYPDRLVFDPIGRQMDANKDFANKKYSERVELKELMKALVDSINVEGESIKSALKCPDCASPYSSYINSSLNHLQCDCGFVLSIHKDEITLCNMDEKYRDLSDTDWGMDRIIIKTNA